MTEKIVQLPGVQSYQRSSEPIIAPNDEVCGNCLFAYRDKQTGDQASCRRFPPSVQLIPQQNALGQMSITIQSISPPVTLGYWCGDFEPAGQIPAIA